ncbi:major intrinsic protein superfamily membrane channel protein [Pisolithus marmoratus]|nr:major intrinsic protein superfamily membrane channel protein [Pisolithus marmoratus]
MSENAGKESFPRHSETSSTYVPPANESTVGSQYSNRRSNRWLVQPPLSSSYARDHIAFRDYVREAAAEFLGTMILIIFGCGGNLPSRPVIEHSGFCHAPGSVLVSGEVSGGHVTLALASFRNFSWKKVPYYILAQLLGALCGGGIVYANYYHAINAYEGGSNIRTYLGDWAAFSEPTRVLASAMLIIAILAATDKRNAPISAILGIGLALGMETGFAINPARDFGPSYHDCHGRLWQGWNQYWLWCPILGPILGMQAGGLVYDLLIYSESESIFNNFGFSGSGHIGK